MGRFLSVVLHLSFHLVEPPGKKKTSSDKSLLNPTRETTKNTEEENIIQQMEVGLSTNQAKTNGCFDPVALPGGWLLGTSSA